MSFASSQVFAQDAIKPPTTKEEPSSPTYVIIIIAVLLTAAVVFSASFRSKRTHQD